MLPMNYNQIKFIKSVAALSQLPPDEGKEIAFAGYSNVGKSSVINAITNTNGLAKASKQPGRTQLINFFMLEEKNHHYLVDLPGYGFAKVPLAIKERWEKTLAEYLRQRLSLNGLVIVMDIRRPLKPFDGCMLDWATASNIPVHIILNKSDKLKNGAAQNMLLHVQKELQNTSGLISVQRFSAMKKTGVEEAHAHLDRMLLTTAR